MGFAIKKGTVPGKPGWLVAPGDPAPSDARACPIYKVGVASVLRDFPGPGALSPPMRPGLTRRPPAELCPRPGSLRAGWRLSQLPPRGWSTVSPNIAGQ